MTQTEALAWAREWIADWNRMDVAAVLAHFADEAQFTSPRALALMGRATVSNKRELEEYWGRARTRVQSLHFELDHVLNDGDRLAIVYIAEVNGVRMRAVEFFRFDDAGRVVAGEAMHGVVLS